MRPAAYARRRKSAATISSSSSSGGADEWGCEGQDEQVGSEAPPDGGAGGAETAVVGLRDGDDVLDVGVPEGTVVPSGVRTVDPAAHGSDDLGLDRLRIGVVAPVVRGAAVLGRDDEAAPGVGGERPVVAGEGSGGERKHRKRDRRRVGKLVFSCHGDTRDGRCASNDPLYPILWNMRFVHGDIANRI